MNDLYLHVDGQQTGPHHPDEVRNLLAQGAITPETPVWHKDLTNWSTVGQLLAPAASAMSGDLPPIPVPPPFSAPLPPPGKPAKEGINGCLLAFLIVALVGVVGFGFTAILAGIALGPITKGIEKAKESASLQTTRTIQLAMFQYATDNNGAYPDGKTSTEVFQKLIDGKYITDPTIFYLDMSGKTKPTSDKLTAENVCYDVTSGITSKSSDFLPTVFTTGYTVTYQAGAAAHRDLETEAPFKDGLAVAYKNNSASFKLAAPDGTVRLFISEQFDPGSETYQQLKP